MKNQLLHTPEGVRDIYNQECERKLLLQERLHRVMKTYGYHDIQTPTFEFFDIFNKERGSVGSREMFKFIDREGNTLVLRPDITPSIARSAAKYYMEEDMPIRFCYMGNTFINNSSYQGRLKETTQLGCELIGDVSAHSDGEMIALMIRCMLEAGLTDFQAELGEVDFFKGLAEETGISEETEVKLVELIENKNYFGMEEVLSEAGISGSQKELFLKLSELFGTVEMLAEAKKLTKNPTALKAIERLEQIYGILQVYGLEKYVSFELGMLGHYKYYTGVIFKGYTYGTGDMLVTGGRYDSLLKQFGKESPAIGFAINVDRLMSALSRQKISVPLPKGVLVLFDSSRQKDGIIFAESLRKSGKQAELTEKLTQHTQEDYMGYGRENQMGELYYLKESGEMEHLLLNE